VGEGAPQNGASYNSRQPLLEKGMRTPIAHDCRGLSRRRRATAILRVKGMFSMRMMTRALLFTALFSIAAIGQASAGPPDTSWPRIDGGSAYTTPPATAAVPDGASTAKAPLTNAAGVPVVVFAGEHENLEAFIDILYGSPAFKSMWDYLLNNGSQIQIQWWNFGAAHNGAYGAYDPQRAGHTTNIGIDPIDRSGKPYSAQILEGNIARAVAMAWAGAKMYQDFQHH
jgi:hypothetical protein